MSEEDRAVKNIIQHYKNISDGDVEIENVFEPEAHYNYYGDRGVVDLYLSRKIEAESGDIYTDHLYEVKSNAAIKNATGANEILRQFNKMRQYFYKDESRTQPPTVKFKLFFPISELAVKHVAKNIDIYLQARHNDLAPESHFADSTQSTRVRLCDFEEPMGDSISLTNLGGPGRLESATHWRNMIEGNDLMEVDEPVVKWISEVVE